MGKNTGAAAADALAKILGVYLTTSAKEKDRAIDERRWQAQFELDKKRSEVDFARAAREQAAYDRQMAEDKDVAGWLDVLKSQGVTPPPEVNTQHELKNWIAMQGDLQDMADKRRKSKEEQDLAPAHKRLLEAQADYYSTKNTTTKPPKNMRERIPEFLRGTYDGLDGNMKFIQTQLANKMKEAQLIDSMDPEAGTKKAAIQTEIRKLSDAQIALFQHKQEIESAVTEFGVDSPEKWDAYNKKLDADFRKAQEDTKATQQPKVSPDAEFQAKVKAAQEPPIWPTNEQGQPKRIEEMGIGEWLGTGAKKAGRTVEKTGEAARSLFVPLTGPMPNTFDPVTGQTFEPTGINLQKLDAWLKAHNTKQSSPLDAGVWQMLGAPTP